MGFYRTFTNVKALGKGVVYDAVRSCLVLANLGQVVEKWAQLGFSDMKNQTLLEGIFVLYFLTVLTPVFRWRRMWPIFRSCWTSRQTLFPALVLAGQLHTLLAYEAAQRTQVVHSQELPESPPQGRQRGRPCGRGTASWGSFKDRARLRRVYARLLERENPGNPPPVADVGSEEEPEGRGCCQRSRARQDDKAFNAAVACSRSKWTAYRHFGGFLLYAFPYNALFFSPHLCFPKSLGFLYKLKFWTVVFDTMFYIVSLRHGAFDPWNLSQAWTWHLKLIMAAFSLYSLRKMSWFCVGPWQCGRLGVFATSPFGEPTMLWKDWVARALENFDWTASTNMWELLPPPTSEVEARTVLTA